jgi:hypothetical protein
MKRRWLAPIVAAVVVLEGCDAVGACLHTFEDPVLAIVRVEGTNVLLTSVTISDVVIASQPVGNPGNLTAPPALGISLLNGALRCDVPCGFGVAEGQYEFTVKAPGYLDQRVTTMASYSRFDGGCPSSNSRSTEITVSLAPTPP